MSSYVELASYDWLFLLIFTIFFSEIYLLTFDLLLLFSRKCSKVLMAATATDRLGSSLTSELKYDKIPGKK